MMKIQSLFLAVCAFFTMMSCSNNREQVIEQPNTNTSNQPIPNVEIPDLDAISAAVQAEDSYWVKSDENQFRPKLSQAKFKSLTGHDFGWYILEPVSEYVGSVEHELIKSVNLSYGQKAIYYWWYLDGQVSNGGFQQFFDNGYGKYLPTIQKGLDHVGEKELSKLLVLVKDYYVDGKKSVIKNVKYSDDYKKIVELGALTPFDAAYLELGEKAMKVIETYAKAHPDEFCKFN